MEMLVLKLFDIRLSEGSDTFLEFLSYKVKGK